MEKLNNEATLLKRDGVEASLNFEVWRVIRDPDTLKFHSETLNQHSAYFQVAVNAHFVAMILPLYRIFERRENSINLPQLIKKLRSNSTLEEDALTYLEQKLDELKPTWVKIAVLRNEVFGHRSSKYDVSESFARAKISSDDLEIFVGDTLGLLNEVDRLLNEKYFLCKTGAGEDLLSILRVLSIK